MSINFENTEIAFSSQRNSELKQAHFLFSAMGNPLLTKIGIYFTNLAFKFHLPIKGIVKSTIFKQFCGGETLEEADVTAQKLNQFGVDVIMDYGVEGKSDESVFDATVDDFIKTINFSKDKKYIPFISMKITGFCRFELLEMVQEGKTLSTELQQEFERVWTRVDKICKQAHDCNKMILIDAEESWIQQPIDDLANAMMERYNKERVVVFNTFQLYCHDRFDYLKTSFNLAQQKNFLLGAKLVRGAYMEKERARAAQLNYASPIQADKASTDNDYNLAVEFCLNNIPIISVFIGTHNDNSCLLATQKMEQLSISKNTNNVHFSQLFGMSDNISFNLAKEGYNVSKYLPYGPVEDVIPYLMRRAQENTSVAGQTGRELALITKELKRRKN
jgi:proline dehydrogenase